MEIVVAIDLGTSRSAWALSVKGFAEDEIIVRAPVGSEPSPDGQTTETAVLLSPDGHEVLAFGNTAHTRYLEQIEEIEDSNGRVGKDVGTRPSFTISDTSEHLVGKPMLFRWFKMELCRNGGFRSVDDPVAIAECGRTLPLLVVMGAVLRLFKEDALTYLSSCRPTDCSVDDVTWVVTIPAIYDDFARRFMRVAAHEAGLIHTVDSPRLRLCLEPEAACLAVSVRDAPELSQPGTQTMVVDCGGGTVDITTHEVLSVDPFCLKELCPPDGGPRGSTYVDSEFTDWCENFLGSETFARVRRSSSFLNVLDQWQSQKAKFGGTEGEFAKINMAGFIQTEDGEPIFNAAKMKELRMAYNNLHQGSDGWQVRGRNFMVTLPSPLVRSLFQPTIDKISTCLDRLKRNPSLSDIKYVFLVGSFSSNPLLQAAVRASLENNERRVVAVVEPGTAIVKGAALYADNSNFQVFNIRKARLTYGVKTSVPFNPDDPEHRRRQGTQAVENSATGPVRVFRFSRHLEYNDDIPLGGICPKQCYRPTKPTQSEVIVEILASHERGVRFADAATTFPEAVVTVPLDMDDDFANRSIEVEFVFGGTEIRVNCFRQATGENVGEATLEFFQEIN